MLVLEDLVGLNRTVQLLQLYWLGIGLHHRDIEWFALEMDRGHCIVFEVASKYCILNSFVDYDGREVQRSCTVSPRSQRRGWGRL